VKSVLIGSVGTSRILLDEMIKVNFPVNMVFSLDEEFSNNVSGYYPLHEFAKSSNIAYTKFKKINDEININIIKLVYRLKKISLQKNRG